MKARPILFSGPMVRALLDGRKTQTRRVLRKQPYISFLNPPRFADAALGDLFVCPDILPTSSDRGNVIVEVTGQGTYHCMGQKAFAEKHCPYGQPGDLLWVRETWALASRATDLSKVYYKAHENASHTQFHELVPTSAIGKHEPTWPGFKPSIHMPRWASRLTLELTDVRVERLHDISEVDKLAEGGTPDTPFGTVWRKINTRPGIRWEDNPWVWALSFRVHQQNVDAVLAAKAAA